MFFRKTEAAPTAAETPPEKSTLDTLRESAARTMLSDHARKAVEKELERLANTDPAVAEYAVGVNYVEFVLSLPWEARSPDNADAVRAEHILNAGHYGLAKVKERLLEYLAVNLRRLSRPLRILVVDDEPIALENMTLILKGKGYLVEGASDGSAALELLSRRRFDLVLTDLKMEQVDGMQLLEEIRQARPDTDVVLVTGYATVDTAVAAMRKGAVNYLPKPVDVETLLATVEGIARRRRLMQPTSSPVLCFAGPPGVGKTSFGRSIASALEREFVRISLAGLRDEAELRGHRRTYVGAMAGRIISELRKVGVRNPVFMLDEVDKICQDFRGDPASVLLEILDPQQNDRFLDYYLDIPFDLSGVMFLTTVNEVERLPAPLLDRMEIITFPSYTLDEKLGIARNHIVPRQVAACGLEPEEIAYADEGIRAIIQGYTREAGVRNLEREVAAVCRKVNLRLLKGSAQEATVIDREMVGRLLGPPRFVCEAAEGQDAVGVATGMVWSEFGGQILFVEARAMQGGRGLILTGSLGEVLKESAQTALSHIRSRAREFGIDPAFFETRDIHIHIPAGSIPKDGPSAGATIAVALLSLLTGRPARRDVAVSGELTLSGRILPVGGLREKLLAAQAAGVSRVVFPKRNECEHLSLDQDVRAAVEAVFAASVDEVFEQALRPRRADG